LAGDWKANKKIDWDRLIGFIYDRSVMHEPANQKNLAIEEERRPRAR